MSARDAGFIRYLQAVLSGRFPRGLGGNTRSPVALGRGGLDALGQGLGRGVLRFLLEQGGVRQGTAYVFGRREDGHHFWRGPLELHFSRSLFEVLTELYRTGSLLGSPADSSGPFTVADEVVLLMLTEAWGAADVPLFEGGRRLIGLGLLPRLYDYWRAWKGSAPEPLALAQVTDPAMGEVLFALRPRMMRGILRTEAMLTGNERVDAPQLALARRDVLRGYFDYIQRFERYELLGPVCRAFAYLLTPGYVDRVAEAIERKGGTGHSSGRQAAFEAALPAWEVLEWLMALRQRSRSLYWDDVDPGALRVLKHVLSAMPDDAWSEARALLACLRYEL